MSWLEALVAPRVFQLGVESTPRRGAFDFYGFTIVDDPATGRKRIYNTNNVVKGTVDAATTAALPANTRTGNVLQADANGQLPNQDGVPPFVGMRILVWKESAPANNGIWKVRQIGTAGGGATPWIFDRDTDADESVDFAAGSVWPVRNGALYGGRVFVLSVAGGFVLNTNAITFALYATPGVYDVRAFGAAGDGTTNDTSAIAAAVAACVAAAGGIVYFSPGTYATDAVTVTSGTGVRLVGAGERSTIIKARQTGNIVTFSSCTGCGLEYLALERKDSLFQSSGGYSLRFTSCNDCWTDNIRISYGTAGVEIHRSNRTHLRGKTAVDHIKAGGGQAALRYIGEAGVATSSKCDVDWLHVEHAYIAASHAYRGNWAITTVYAAGDLVFANDRWWECTTGGTSAGAGTGPSTIPGSDGPTAYSTGVTDNGVTWRFLIGNSFICVQDNDANDLVLKRFDCIGPCSNPLDMRRSSGTGAPTGLTVLSGRIEGGITSGVNLDRGSRVFLHPDIKRVWGGRGISVNTNFGGGVQIDGGRVEEARTNGIALDSGGVLINGTEVSESSQEGSAVHAGILVQNVNGVRITSCKSSGSLQAHGLAIAASADQFVVAINNFLGNVTGGISNAAGTSATKVVANNI